MFCLSLFFDPHDVIVEYYPCSMYRSPFVSLPHWCSKLVPFLTLLECCSFLSITDCCLLYICRYSLLFTSPSASFPVFQTSFSVFASLGLVLYFSLFAFCFLLFSVHSSSYWNFSIDSSFIVALCLTFTTCCSLFLGPDWSPSIRHYLCIAICLLPSISRCLLFFALYYPPSLR